jgi:predicted PurR-regulated permease PerM
VADLSRPERVLLVFAAIVVIAAGLKAAAVILVPGLLALFIAIVCSEPMKYMIGAGVPRWLSIVIIFFGLLGMTAVVPVVIGNSLASFTEQLPLYQERLDAIILGLTKTLEEYGYSEFDLSAFTDTSAALGWVQVLLGALGGILSRYFLILILIIFILVDWPKAEELGQGTSLEILRNIQHYFAIKTFTSFVTGSLITGWVMLLGIDYPLLWGFLGFVLNFVPNIGSVLAAVPPVLLALLFQGWGMFFVASFGYVAINVGVSNFFEPRIMGQQLGLRFVVIFVSLILWGYILGPVGMLLAVPLTIILRIVLEINESTRWISALLAPSKETPITLAVDEKASSARS